MWARFVPVTQREYFIPEHKVQKPPQEQWQKGPKEKKNKFLNCLLLTSQLPMGQTVISVSPCSAFCSLEVSVLFWIITFSWKEVLQLWLKKKKNPVNGNTQLNTLVFTLQWSFPDVQSNALIYQPQRFWKKFILLLCSWRSVIAALLLAFTA